jgi:PAS domain S-box-containing protein
MAGDSGRGIGFRALLGGEIASSHRAGTGIGPGDGDRARTGIAIGLLILLPVVVLDILVGGDTQLVLVYMLGVFAAALSAVSSTMVIGALVVVLATISPLWNHNGGSELYWLRLAGVLASCIFAIYIARRWRRVSRLSGRLGLLDEINAMADGSLPLDETLAHALEQIVPGAADFCMIDTIRDAEVTRIGTRVRGRSDWREIERGLRTRRPSTPPWLRNPEFGIPPVPMFLPRVTSGHEEILSHDPEDLAFLRSLGMRSCAIMPMTARGRLLGTLTLGVAWSRRSYDRDDLAFARALASRLALALDHAGLFSDLESVERRMDAVMARIPESVTVTDGRGRLVYANEVTAEWLGLDSPAPLAGKRVEWIGERLSAFTEDGESLTGRELLSPSRSEAGPSRRLVRMVEQHSGRERWGLVSSDVIRGPEGEALYTVTTTEDVTTSKRAELGERLLARAGTMLAGASDLREALENVAQDVVPDLADGCAIVLTSKGGDVELVALGGAVARTEATAGTHIGKVLEARQALRTNLELGPAIAAPINSGDATIGVITLANREGGRPLGAGDLALATDIGARLGTAIEAARVTAMRREIASTLQRALEPDPLPEIDGWKLDSMYRPAGELNEVGGDFYEVIEVENGWMVVVGDVLGRGASAAAITAVARNTIRTALTLTGDPREAFRVLNDRLCSRQDQPLCSVVIVVLPASDDEGPTDAVVTCAGHPMPLVIRGQEVVEACGPGPLLGALPEASWTLGLVSLSPGEQMVIYTDGIIEARVDGGFLGESGLAACLGGAENPRAAVERIEAALANQAVEVADDAAAVALMRLPAASAGANATGRPRLAAADPG